MNDDFKTILFFISILFLAFILVYEKGYERGVKRERFVMNDRIEAAIESAPDHCKKCGTLIYKMAKESGPGIE